MAKIYTDKSRPKPYEVRWSWYDANGTRHSRKKRFLNRKAADAHFRKVTADENHDPQQGKESFEAWATRYIAFQRARVKPSTLQKVEGILEKRVLPEFGHRRIDSITTADIEDFIDSEPIRDLSPATIRHYFLVVSGVLGFATKRRAISINPAKGVSVPTDHSAGRIKPLARFLSPAEVSALSDAIHIQSPDTPYGLLITFMAYTGLRASEVSGLRVADVDTMRKVVHVHRTLTKVKGGWREDTTKNRLERRVRLPEWLALDLAEYLGTHPNRRNPSAPLWPGRKVHDAARFKGAKGGLDWDRGP